MTPEHRTSEHMLELNHRAQQLKNRRHQIRRDVSAGRMTASAALSDPAIAKLRVIDVLAWQSRWSADQAERFVRDYEICTPFAYANQLTDRQRMLVARGLRVGKMAA